MYQCAPLFGGSTDAIFFLQLSSVANNMFETIQVSHEAYVILLNCEIFSCCFRIAIGSDATFLTFDLLHLFPAVTVALSSKIK